jgi:hypothetical protein
MATAHSAPHFEALRQLIDLNMARSSLQHELQRPTAKQRYFQQDDALNQRLRSPKHGVASARRRAPMNEPTLVNEETLSL